MTANSKPDGEPMLATRAVFRESLDGLVTPVDSGLVLPMEDRARCALIEDHLLLGQDHGRATSAWLNNLEIAVDVSQQGSDGALLGVVRAGQVRVPGVVDGQVREGRFELLGGIEGDGLRMRYDVTAVDALDRPWRVLGTKLVTDDSGGWRGGRVWRETTTLFTAILGPDGMPVALGTVAVRPAGFLRQVSSIHGEPGPGGGVVAVGRLVEFFLGRLRSQYLPGRVGHGGPGDEIEYAFTAADGPTPGHK